MYILRFFHVSRHGGTHMRFVANYKSVLFYETKLRCGISFHLFQVNGKTYALLKTKQISSQFYLKLSLVRIKLSLLQENL